MRQVTEKPAVSFIHNIGCIECLLRGLIHSDGCRGLNRVRSKAAKWYEYSRYQVTNHAKDIREIFCRACDAYGVRWRQMNWKTIAVSRRSDVATLDLVIGPKS